MMWLRRHLSYANVTATLALVIALGGTSYAVSRVGTNDVIDNSLRSRDVRNDSLRSKDVRNQTLRGRDVRQNALGEREIRERSLAKVPAAIDADRLGGMTADGLRLRCPPDTRRVGAVCIENNARGTGTFTGATSTCAALGRDIPAMPQLDYVARLGGVSPDGEWTSNVYLEPPETNPPIERLEALVIRGGGTIDHSQVNAPVSHQFRCVALPSN